MSKTRFRYTLLRHQFERGERLRERLTNHVVKWLLIGEFIYFFIFFVYDFNKWRQNSIIFETVYLSECKRYFNDYLKI